MGRNLTNLYISSSFQFITQISGSELQDGLGNKITGSLDITASRADNATSASFASTSVSSSYSTTALSASYAETATSSSVAINATSASYATNALSSSYALTASYAANANVNTGSLMVTGSVNSNTLTFTKGDGSTFNLTVNTGSGGAAFPYTGSAVITGSLTVTGSGTFSNKLSVTQSTNDDTNGVLNVYSTRMSSDIIRMYEYGQQAYIKAPRANGQFFIETAGGANDPVVINNSAIIYPGRIDITVPTTISSSLVITGSVASTTGFTGSLNGTASFAVSASWAPGSNPFPFTGSAQITGSLGVTGSIGQNNGLKTQINTGATTLNTNPAHYQVVIGTDSAGGTATSNYSTVVGTRLPFVTGVYASTLGGNILTASANWSTAIGGEQNQASGIYSTVIGGTINKSLGQGAFVAGGFTNTVNVGALQAAIIGGEYNTISSGTDCAVVGSFGSTITAASYAYGIYGALESTINGAGGYSANIFGGSNHTISSTGASGNRAIFGGQSNQIKGGSWNGVVLGQGNIISGSSDRSVIIGGLNNLITDFTSSVIIGGNNITATAHNTVYVPNLDVSGSLYDSLNSTGSSGQVLSSNASGKLEWIAAGGSTNTGSLLTTASAAGNVITFTKGDASTFNVTVATGSAGGAAFGFNSVNSGSNNLTFLFSDTSSNAIPMTFTANSSGKQVWESIYASGSIFSSYGLNYTNTNIDPSYLSPSKGTLILGGTGHKVEGAPGFGNLYGASALTMIGGLANIIGNGAGHRGSVLIGGSNNSINRYYPAGQDRYAMAVVGGENNECGGSSYAGIYSGGNNIIKSNALSAGIFVGLNNTIGTNSSYTAIIGGTYNNVADNITGSVILGGNNITASADNTTYVPNLNVSGSTTQNGFVILSQVSASLNFVDDTAAAAGGVPLGGLYRNGNAIMIRLT